MVKHVILWTLKEEFDEKQKAEIKKGIKEGLEGLFGKIPGLTEIKVYTEGLASSNADLMLDSTFESAEALKGYAVHPDHVAVADGKVRPFTATRSCLDFEIWFLFPTSRELNKDYVEFLLNGVINLWYVSNCLKR